MQKSNAVDEAPSKRESPTTDPRVYLAAERTFLAWIRTGMALMGFGFLLARFGFFLREFQPLRSDSPPRTGGFSIWFGVALVVIGVIINLASIGYHLRLVRSLKDGSFDLTHPSKLAIAVAATLAIVGVAMAFYLVLVR
jgi:putative membrane protein